MIKIRGPFSDRVAAEAWVASVAKQGVPFKEYVEREIPRKGILGPPEHVQTFAIFDDPEATWPDEHLAFDDVRQSWRVMGDKQTHP